jgi:hypothetical protein
MIQFLIFITIMAILGAIFYAKSEALTRKSKIVALLVVGHAIGFGWFYELNNANQSEHNRDVLSAFKQGKILTCKEIEVNNKGFIYISGTLSFMPNDANVEHKGLVIDIATCNIK